MPARKSAAIAKAQVDIANLKSVDPTLDFGNDLSIAAVLQLLETTQAEIEALNTSLNAITQARKAIRAKERALKKLIERLQHGIALKYGKDSDQYQMINPTIKRRKSATSETSESGSSDPSTSPQNQANQN
jgi:predicted nucleotide-binding protein (sugar kinase/HSP70/actin superfamily)